jgi:hypothetical protein
MQKKTIVARGQYPFTNSGADNGAAAWQKALFSIIEQIPQPIISSPLE